MVAYDVDCIVDFAEDMDLAHQFHSFLMVHHTLEVVGEDSFLQSYSYVMTWDLSIQACHHINHVAD
jgi:hypothetical protein